MDKTIVCNVTVEGFHNWPNAPEQFSYLRSKHRHMFNIELHIPVSDLNRMRQLIEDNEFKAQVYVSPVFGKIEPKDIVDYMKTYNLQGVRLQLQIHKFIWPPDMKGV